MFEFRNLEIYKKAKQFHLDAKILIEKHKFDRTTKDQLTRASFSIPLNIAEGSGRFSKPDRKNFFIIARSSVFECVAIFDIMMDRKLISTEEFNHFNQCADEISRILYTMIKNLS